MGLAEDYARDIRQNLKLYANWPLGEPAELGDYGFVNNEIFTRKGTLADLGIEFSVRPDRSADQIDYRSKGSVDVALTGKGQGAGGKVVSAKVKIGFRKENAVFLNLADCSVETIASLDRLNAAFEELGSDWNSNYHFISRIVRSRSSTIAISTGSQGNLVLRAAADVEQIDLADAEVKLGVESESNVGMKVVSRRGLTPLLGLARYSSNPYSGQTGVEVRDTGGDRTVFEVDPEAWDEVVARG